MLNAKTDGKQSVEKSVKSAFDEARKGNFEPSLRLKRFGKSAIPYLEKYLKDEAVEIRKHLVFLLGEFKIKEGLPLLAEALKDSEPQIQEEAVNVLFEKYPRKTVSSYTQIAEPLKESVRKGNKTVSALILLGYFPDAGVEEVLKPFSQNADKENLTKLYEWSPLVDVSLPAKISLSMLGDSNAQRDLLQIIEANDLENLQFLLEIIEDIDAPPILHLLKKTLDDERAVGGSVPSGAAERRLCDLAVDAYVERLALKVDFKLSDYKRYTEQQIAQVKKKIDSSIPQS